MCGIAGGVTYGDGPPWEESELVRLRDAQRHRGPDDAGIWISPDGRVGLAHRRLAIVDLSPLGHQPMASDDGRFRVVFNGEIYNFRALRGELEARGHRFRSESDTEVLLHGWREWDLALLDRLRGMFAFALHDAARRETVLARDPLGIKPCYLLDDGRRLLFASEVQALRAVAADGGIDPEGVAEFLLWGSIAAPRTLYRGVRALPAGSFVRVRERAVEAPVAYFRLEQELGHTQPMAADEAAAALREALLDSVRHHLVADVPVGAFLSGGVDSSALVGLMAEVHGAPIRTVTLALDDPALDEAGLARVAADRYRTDHHEVAIRIGEVRDRVFDAVRSLDLPSIDGINTFFVSEATAKTGLKVAVSGVGGDELFGGYRSFERIPRMRRIHDGVARLPGGGVLLAAGARGIAALSSSPVAAKFARAAAWAGDDAGAYYAERGLFTPAEVQALLEPGLASAVEACEPRRAIGERLRLADLPPDERVAALEMRRYLEVQLLRDTDATAMRHSLEVRTPLVDRDLLRAAARVPASERRAGPAKRQLREAPRPPVPDALWRRRKQGFTLPFERWLRSGSLPIDVGALPGLRPGAIDRVVSGFRARQHHWSRVWALLVLQRFLPLLLAALLAAGAGIDARAADACVGACPAPTLAAPEPALRRAVHLAWSDAHAALATRYEIERRPRREAGAWTAVAQLAADQAAHYDDAGPGGAGLAPGEYEYRLRGLHRGGVAPAWSEWSPAQAVAVLEACGDAGGELAGLPRVVADDRNGDGRYTGADLERALHECSRLGGCVLEALPVTYDDVAIVLSDGDGAACDPSRTACLTDAFPKGLAIEGHGGSTVLRSPLWRSPYQPGPLLEIWHRPDLRIQLRHLVLDGRKREQGAPRAGQNDSNGWRHVAFGVWNQWRDHDQRNRGGCVHDVTIRDFMSRGISLADVAGWSIEHSAIEDIGCASRLTPCPALGIPDAYGPGYTSTGYGVYVDWYSDDVVVRANRIRRVTKYALGFKHAQDGSEASIRRPRVIDNALEQTGQLGIFVGGVADGLFQGNRIAATDSLNPQPEARAWNDTFGISCNGALERTRFEANRIEDSGGMAIQWACTGPGNSLAATRIRGSCREKGPKSCAPGAARSCYGQPDVWVAKAGGSLALVDNTVEGSLCAAPLSVDQSAPGLDVVIRGGRYAAGREATQPVRFQSVDVLIEAGARFEDTSLAFGPTSRAILAPSVSVSGKPERFQIDRGAQVLACPERLRYCEELCSSADAPAWCEAPAAPARR